MSVAEAARGLRTQGQQKSAVVAALSGVRIQKRKQRPADYTSGEVKGVVEVRGVIT
jgi:hypothetical protein